MMTTTTAKMTPAKKMTHRSVPIDKFAQDLWEALRRETREQLAESISDQEFAAWLPAWTDLDPQARDEKIKIARDELRVLDSAGYQVRQKAA